MTGARLMSGSNTYYLNVTSNIDFSQVPTISVQGSADNFRTPAPASVGGVDSEWLIATFVPRTGTIPWPLGAAATSGSFTSGMSNVHFGVKIGNLTYDQLYDVPISPTGYTSTSPWFFIPFDQGDLNPSPSSYVYWLKMDPRTCYYSYVYGVSSEPTAIPSGTGTYLGGGSAVAPQGTITFGPGPGDMNAAKDGTTSFTMAEVLGDAAHPMRTFMLGRPLRSVGELGYIFRELPWQTLNLNYQNNQDRTWLDCLSVIEEPAVSAGRWNLNTPFPSVMGAYLTNATKKFGDLTTLNAGQVTDIVNQIINAGTPASSLNGKIGATNPATGTKSPMPFPGGLTGRGWSDMGNLKEEKEAVVRALASAGQTRTWNFFIDLIAQSGRMQSKATNLANYKFNTQGEQHLWVHVAIDRFTGKVVASQVEVCQE